MIEKDPIRSGVRLDLEVGAGSGVSRVAVGLTPALFDQLAKTMIAADRQAALIAFARATLSDLDGSSD